jgi:FtsP/CotA-like multicopper oxidase with cupredoxin domain
LATGYVLADSVAEAAFDAANPAVPSALDLEAINSTFFYLIFQDKIFVPPAGPPTNYPLSVNPGDLFYAYFYDPALFGPPGVPSFGQTLNSPPPIPSCVPEFFGDTILVNGTAYPVLEVEARPIRIRMLNACNARFLNPRLVSPAGTTFPNNAEPSPSALGPRFIQIGNEGGYLPQPVALSGAAGAQLLVAPAERADILIDFSKAKAGTEFILYNDAPGPFPGGAAIFDYYPKNPKTPTSIPGYGPNTRTLMKFRIKAATGTVTPLPNNFHMINLAINGLNDPPLVAQTPGVPTPIPTQVTVNGGTYPVSVVRTLTLSEGFDEYGRLAQFLGANIPAANAVPGFFGWPYLDPTTENVGAGTVEVWQLINTTADAHPIHFHLVNVQILYRQAVKTKGFVGTITVTPNGQPYAPALNELGWKEAVRMHPGEVTVVIAKFDLPTVPFDVPDSPRTGGNEYVYHCHILEHEEHDMMRPLVVK